MHLGFRKLLGWRLTKRSWRWWLYMVSGLVRKVMFRPFWKSAHIHEPKNINRFESRRERFSDAVNLGVDWKKSWLCAGSSIQYPSGNMPASNSRVENLWLANVRKRDSPVQYWSVMNWWYLGCVYIYIYMILYAIFRKIYLAYQAPYAFGNYDWEHLHLSGVDKNELLPFVIAIWYASKKGPSQQQHEALPSDGTRYMEIELAKQSFGPLTFEETSPYLATACIRSLLVAMNCLWICLRQGFSLVPPRILMLNPAFQVLQEHWRYFPCFLCHPAQWYVGWSCWSSYGCHTPRFSQSCLYSWPATSKCNLPHVAVLLPEMLCTDWTCLGSSFMVILDAR